MWNDSFLVPIRGRPTGRELLKVQLWDWDMGKTDDFVGVVQVHFDLGSILGVVSILPFLIQTLKPRGWFTESQH